MPHTYIYCRASTDKQSLSVPGQEIKCREYHKTLATLPPIRHVFRDNAVSGSIPLDQRPDGHELLLNLGHLDHLIVDSFDRLGRDIPDVLNSVRIVHARRAIPHILNLLILSKIEPDDPLAETMITQYAQFAQFERKMRSIHTKRGLAARRALGYADGSRTPVGYRREPNPAWYEGCDRSIGRTLLIPCEEDAEFFNLVYDRHVHAGDKLTRAMDFYKNHHGYPLYTYGRMRRMIEAEENRRRQNEVRLERQRVFGEIRA
jgi:DNA invertase Pin-like site-specific DNA recombinase